MDSAELSILIGEFVATEIDDVSKIEYVAEGKLLAGFTAVMENGNRFLVTVTAN